MSPTIVNERREGEGECQNLTMGDASRPKKKGRKTALTFELQPAADHERLWDGRVVEDNNDPQNEIDGSFSVEDPRQETETYNLDALLGHKDPVTNPGLPGKVPMQTSMSGQVNKPIPGAPVSSDTLSDEGYVPILGFKPHPAFGSLNNLSSTQKQQPSMRSNWRQPTETTEVSEHPTLPVVDAAPVKQTTVEDDDMDTASDASGDSQESGTAEREFITQFLDSGANVKHVMRAALENLPHTQLRLFSDMAHAQTARVFHRLGFANVSKDTHEYI